MRLTLAPLLPVEKGNSHFYKNKVLMDVLYYSPGGKANSIPQTLHPGNGVGRCCRLSPEKWHGVLEASCSGNVWFAQVNRPGLGRPPEILPAGRGQVVVVVVGAA